MSKEYYQQEKYKREYFIAKLTEFQTEFQKYKDSPELKSIYSSVEQEIEQQLRRQRDTVSRIEVSLQTAPVVPATVPTTTAPGDQTPATGDTGICRSDNRYPPFEVEPQTGLDPARRTPDGSVFDLTFGFIEPRSKETNQYFTNIRNYIEILDNTEKGNDYKIMKLISGKGNQCNAYFDLGKFIEFSSDTYRDTTNYNKNIESSSNIKITFSILQSGDITDFINTGKGQKITIFGAQTEEIELKPEETLIQAASQFNYLEMIATDIKPAYGIGKYLADNTQGPGCAIPTYPATLYRNSILTKSNENQLNALKDFDSNLMEYFVLNNGYLLGNYKKKMDEENKKKIINEFKEKLRIGVLLDTEVVLNRKRNNGINEYRRIYPEPTDKNPDGRRRVSLAWCSGMPLGPSYYGRNQDGKSRWNELGSDAQNYIVEISKVELNKTYDLTFQAAIKYGLKNIVLTFVGGGEFKNNLEDIYDSIISCVERYQDYPLNVFLFLRQGSKDYEVKSKFFLRKFPEFLKNGTASQFNSPISLNQVKKKKKKKDKKREEKLNAFKLNREKREEKLKNMMK